jgi:hypothetical protein
MTISARLTLPDKKNTYSSHAFLTWLTRALVVTFLLFSCGTTVSGEKISSVGSSCDSAASAAVHLSAIMQQVKSPAMA